MLAMHFRVPRSLNLSPDLADSFIHLTPRAKINCYKNFALKLPIYLYIIIKYLAGDNLFIMKLLNPIKEAKCVLNNLKILNRLELKKKSNKKKDYAIFFFILENAKT
ncbi:hypothetical protein BpHYR1_024843 [Brachionus plicatilis]|uniref:Uncharacterized protein n=1 Tax=Brachionus plicatilis TaxID=10195 RepID=A0A3M7PKV3_BRAPC|nr:hypothetical protein BpHYR1_024843 [Brachionus plicatilis]